MLSVAHMGLTLLHQSSSLSPFSSLSLFASYENRILMVVEMEVLFFCLSVSLSLVRPFSMRDRLSLTVKEENERSIVFVHARKFLIIHGDQDERNRLEYEGKKSSFQ